ncbi:MAG TPA: efflux RND transporter periplasmic adaptor subunit [Polyangiaceae bacterium]|nr:efflux RND transporter periplasmic adaptor subunit [Polyangiaceae bacterium]
MHTQRARPRLNLPLMSARPDAAAILAETKSRRRRARIYQFIGLLLLVGVGAAVFLLRNKSSKAKGVRYLTATAQVGDLKETVTATGTLKGLDSVDVGAQISGKITKINVDFNDHVTVGQVLAEIDTAQLQSRVEQSKAQVNAADASLVLAKATQAQTKAQYLRSLDLSQKGLISSKDLDSAKADADRATASITSATAQATLARASLKDAQTQLSYAVIRSPIDGMVLSRLVEPGQTVAATMSAPVLFTLARDLTQLRLYVDVDEADVGKVKEGQSASFLVDAWNGHSFASKVVSVHNLPTTGQTVVTYQAVLSVDNSERLLRPGMTATATITTDERKGVLLVPNAALRFSPPVSAKGSAAGGGIPFLGGSMPGGPPRTGGGGAARSRTGKKVITAADSQGLVYLLEEGRPKRTVVEIAGTDGERTEIKSGLAAGAQVITEIDLRKAE